MKSLTLFTAFFLVCIVAISQVQAIPVKPTKNTEGVTSPIRVEQPEAIFETCAPTMNAEQAHNNLIMAICEQIHPGFIRNMMEPGTVSNVMQKLGRRDIDTDEVAHTAQFPPFPPPTTFPPFPPFPPPPTFPPFPPFPPPPTFPPFPPFPPPPTFPPFPPFPPPPTFPPFPPFPPNTGGRGGGGRHGGGHGDN